MLKEWFWTVNYTSPEIESEDEEFIKRGTAVFPEPMVKIFEEEGWDMEKRLRLSSDDKFFWYVRHNRIPLHGFDTVRNFILNESPETEYLDATLSSLQVIELAQKMFFVRIVDGPFDTLQEAVNSLKFFTEEVKED